MGEDSGLTLYDAGEEEVLFFFLGKKKEEEKGEVSIWNWRLWQGSLIQRMWEAQLLSLPHEKRR